MNKNSVIFLFSLLLVIILGTYYINHSNNKISDTSIRDFKVDEIDLIDKIILTNPNSSPIVLQKNETEWTLNSKYPTKTKQIDELLRIASMLEAKNRSKTNSTKGLKVEYFAGDELIKSYFLMISESDSIGTSACIKNSSQAFVVHVPGEEPNFSKLFSPFIQDWRSLTIVQVKGSSKKIKISYFDKPQNSFSMELVQEIPKLYDFKDKNIFKINLEKAATYLRQLKNIEAKKILTSIPMKGDKIFELTIEGNQKIIGYRKKAEKNQKDFAGNVLEYDNEYFYGQQGNDWYLLDYFTFDGVLKTPLDFKNDFKNDLKHE